MTEPVLRLVQQRGSHDCCIAALASYLGRDYEDVLAAAVAVQFDPKIHRKGMWMSQIERTSAALGHPLKRHRRWDWEASEGILCLTGKADHVVILKAGLVFNSADATIWEPDVYLSAEQYAPTLLLTREN